MRISSGFRASWTALRAMLVLTLLLGVAYPLIVTGVGQLAFPAQANGSIVTVNGAPTGSTLVGQSFSDADGTPLARYFQPRPSAAGKGYDAGASSGSNYGPENPDLVAAIQERKAAVAALENVDPALIPADALTASASGLDPDISEAYALLQVPRIAKERGMAEAAVKDMVQSHVQQRDLGFLGEPTVNVLQLNIALDGVEGRE